MRTRTLVIFAEFKHYLQVSWSPQPFLHLEKVKDAFLVTLQETACNKYREVWLYAAYMRLKDYKLSLQFFLITDDAFK